MTDTSIDTATWVMAGASCLSFFVITCQAVFMKWQTDIANEQKEVARQQKISSDKILSIELNRDRQANLICAWLEATVYDSNTFDMSADSEILYLSPRKWFSTKIILTNASNLPIYNLSFKLTCKRGNEKIGINPPIGISDEKIKVIGPQSHLLNIWSIEGWQEAQGDMVSTINHLQGASWSEPISLVEEGFTRNDFKSLNLTIEFQSADGDIWIRNEFGKLTPKDQS